MLKLETVVRCGLWSLCCKSGDGSLEVGPGADVSADRMELLLLFLSPVGKDSDKLKSICDGNGNSRAGIEKKSWVSRVKCDDKSEGGSPRKVSEKDTPVSAPTDAFTVTFAVIVEDVSSSQYTAGSGPN